MLSCGLEVSAVARGATHILSLSIAVLGKERFPFIHPHFEAEFTRPSHVCLCEMTLHSLQASYVHVADHESLISVWGDATESEVEVMHSLHVSVPSEDDGPLRCIATDSQRGSQPLSGYP